MPDAAIYKLDPIVDDPRFEGFAFVRQESIRGKVIGGCSRLAWDFDSDDIKTKGRAWTVPSLTPFWTPQHVVGRVRAFNDYPSVNLTIPAFSRRAVDALCDFLEPNGELLPLVSTVGEYYAYNTRTVADALDEQRSEIQWLTNQTHTFDHVFEIHRYEFFPEKLIGLSIFLLVEGGTRTFVSQAFVDRVREHELQGFHFIKLWPLPAGVNRQEEAPIVRSAKGREYKGEGAALASGNTVVLRLPTAKSRPSKKEKARVAELMDEIDALLYVPTAKLDSPYAGSLEGDEKVEGEVRLFLSCPDADALVEKLRPWLKTISWKGGVMVLKRYGHYTDVESPEEYDDEFGADGTEASS